MPQATQNNIRIRRGIEKEKIKYKSIKPTSNKLKRRGCREGDEYPKGRHTWAASNTGLGDDDLGNAEKAA